MLMFLGAAMLSLLKLDLLYWVSVFMGEIVSCTGKWEVMNLNVWGGFSVYNLRRRESFESMGLVLNVVRNN